MSNPHVKYLLFFMGKVTDRPTNINKQKSTTYKIYMKKVL